MMKSVLLVTVLVVAGQSQRPPYAGSANRYPQVLDRFKDDLTTTSTTTTVAPSTSTIVDRLGESSSTATPTSSSPVPTSTSSAAPDGILYPSEELPVLSLGDAALVDRIKTWPREKQPWWYVNRIAIQEHLHPVGSGAAQPAAQPAPNSFFAG